MRPGIAPLTAEKLLAEKSIREDFSAPYFSAGGGVHSDDI
jgi:hypothetical protein